VKHTHCELGSIHRWFFIKKDHHPEVRKVVQIRSLLVQHYLIVHHDTIDLIDAGFLGGISQIKKALTELGKDLCDIRSIILTHGHLDHTLNVAKLQKISGCQVFTHQRERAHVEGRHHYRGLTRLCGWLEAIGRLLFRFQAPKITQYFHDGDQIMGLKVIALPGHTDGHCGFLLEKEKLLIAGDLLASHFGKNAIPPRILNDDHAEAKQSIRKAAAMDLNGVLLNHAKKLPPKDGLLALVDLADHL